jgi:hypothetical protein
LSPIGIQQIPVNNALFERKNDDLDPKPGPIYQFIVSILIAYHGDPLLPSSKQDFGNSRKYHF